MVFHQTNSRIASKIGALIITALIAVSCATNNAPFEKEARAQRQGPALWKITNDNTIVYLLGGQELLPDDLIWRDATIASALTDADVFILEGDQRPEAQAALQQLIPQLGINRDGRTLRDFLTEDEEMEIGAVSASLGAPLPALDQLRPWLAALQLDILHISRKGYQTRSGVAGEIIKIAETQTDDLRFFEAPGDLLKVMSELPEETQVKMLVKAARDIRDKPDAHDELVRFWSQGNLTELARILHSDEDGVWADRIVYDALVVQRNKAWMKQITQMLDENDGTFFVMVGIGHFVGDDSLISLLENAGINAILQ